MTVLPWWPIALKELGVAEVAGPGDNPRITAYLGSTGLPTSLAQDDETPWCSAFVQWCVNQVGVKGTGSAWARSWLEWGHPWLSPMEAPLGAVLVFARPGGGGHVGFWAGLDGTQSIDHLLVLGGNAQQDLLDVAAAGEKLDTS